MVQTLDVAGAKTRMGLFEAKPQGAARGAIIVFQEAFGITPHIEDVCRRVAAEGYLAVAPYIYHRSGDPVIAYDKVQDVIPYVMQIKRETLDADVDATLAYLNDAGFGPKQVGILGFCLGGSMVLATAVHRALGAAVTYYGGGITQGRFGLPGFVELASQLKTPWLGLYGDADQSIPMTEVEMLRKVAAKAAVPTQIVRYPEADHGFNCDARASYHEASAKDAWQHMVRWMSAHLGAR
jgi:carboxymethylenebutenolidase